VIQRISTQEAASLSRQPFLCLDKLLPANIEVRFSDLGKQKQNVSYSLAGKVELEPR
jgi:hypothetical protein